MRQQPDPDLPPDRLLVVADKVGELERLLEFLEEQLDGLGVARSRALRCLFFMRL